MSSRTRGRLDAPDADGRGAPKRRAYEPPRILYREALEGVAAACIPNPAPGPGNTGGKGTFVECPVYQFS